MTPLLLSSLTHIARCCIGRLSVWGLLVMPVAALAQSPRTDETQSMASKDGMTVVAPASTNQLKAGFLAANPGARVHELNMDMQDEEGRPQGLRLVRMWVGPSGTLLELLGLPAASGRPNSAVIRKETFSLEDHRQRVGLLAQEGALELRDAKGGSALVVRPGMTFFAHFPAVDDLRPMQLLHVDPDWRTFVYFDRIDPRFRERYEQSFAQASAPSATPEAMKDFLVDFASNDPDKKAPMVFMKLLNAMRAQNSFEGYYTAYLLVQQPEDAEKAWKLARTDSDREKLENMAVATLADKSRMLDFDLQLNPSRTSQSEGACFILCRYNFKAIRPLSGRVSVSLKSTSPIRLKLGQYKVMLSAAVHLPRRKLRESGVLGNYDGPDDIQYTKDIEINLSPPAYRATVPVDLGALYVAFFQRGSAGGFEGAWATSDASIRLGIKSVELKP